MDSFGQLLRRLREGRLSQGALALRAATSQSYVSRVEAGEVIPTLGQAEHLVNCLGYRLSVQGGAAASTQRPRCAGGAVGDEHEERMQSAAALHNAMAEMKAGLSGG